MWKYSKYVHGGRRYGTVSMMWRKPVGVCRAPLAGRFRWHPASGAHSPEHMLGPEFEAYFTGFGKVPYARSVNMLAAALSDPTDSNHRLFGTHYCGPGGGGNVTGPLDAACKGHDICYRNGGLQWYDNFNPANFLNGRGTSIQNCNQQLCNATTSIPGAASGRLDLFPADRILCVPAVLKELSWC